MTYEPYRRHYEEILGDIRSSGMWKEERLITTPQRAGIEAAAGGGKPSSPCLNFCANNYLGLADHPEIVAAAAETMQRYGYGLASVRFICGTQDLHRKLETSISSFLGTDETILYSSCFDANAAVFETLLGPEDAIISDALNHASIIDGIRLSKAKRRIVRHGDIDDYRAALDETRGARVRLVVTDGVFSMHGDIARLPQICELLDGEPAILVVDDSHATGVLGPGGRGTAEHFALQDRVDLITSTFGKALGGASGGFASGRRELVTLLRQRSRPYLFSNTLAPAMAGGAMKAFEILQREPERIRRLQENTRLFREEIQRRGFRIAEGVHPIVPIMIGDEKKTVEMARRLYERGLFVVGFTYPVVPRGEARIRVQISAGHTREDLERALAIFAEVKAEIGE
ncbi:MAG: glycine C-acetyltransferase [Planctomycetes bacterium]|nr:glycine C-acetyltransferase [Planctomycetota bacterium]